MSSKEKVLAIRPEATLRYDVVDPCEPSDLYWWITATPDDESEVLAILCNYQEEAWAAAYKYLTK